MINFHKYMQTKIFHMKKEKKLTLAYGDLGLEYARLH